MKIKNNSILCLRVKRCNCGQGEQVLMSWERKSGKRKLTKEIIGLNCKYCGQVKIDTNYIMKEKSKQIFTSKWDKSLDKDN